MDFIKRTFPFLLGIFLLSVLVRMPLLNRPLSKHHEFCTAISLRILDIWYDNGIAKYGYNPVMTYNNPADKFINNNANSSGKMIDEEGNYYYVSHPPFAYYFPFFIFKILHVRPSVLSLQTLNLCFHFLSGLFVYFIVCLLSFNRARSYPYRSAIVAFVIYIFMPPTLWFQGNVYMSDMAVHLLFVIGVYTVLKMIIREKFSSPKYIFFYTICLAMMIYTSWLGVFFAFGVLVYSLLRVQGTKGFRVLIWNTIVVSLILLPLTVYQYSQINGLDAYLGEMINRYIQRGSLEATDKGLFHFLISYVWLLKTLVYNYLANYIVIYAFLLSFIWIIISRKKMKMVFSENGYRFIWLSVMPVVLMHVFFLNYSTQDFTTLYASLFFSVLIGVLYDKVKKSATLPLRNLQWGLTAVVLLMVGQYYLENYRKDIRFDETAGKFIAANSTKEEVIFCTEENIDPQLVFYAHRNIKQVKDTGEARAFLRQRGIATGVMFYITPQGTTAQKVTAE